MLFKSKFDSWPQTPDVTVSEDGRGKVAGKWLIIMAVIMSWYDFLNITFLSIVICHLNFFLLFMTLYIVALLKRQGVNVKGLLKADAVKEEPQPYIDCTGHLQVLC